MKIKTRSQAMLVNMLLRIVPLRTSNKSYIARRSILRAGTAIGAGTRINGAVFVRGNGSLTIGNYCAMGHEIRFITSNHGVGNVAMQYQLQRRLGLARHFGSRCDIKIGHGAWIGDRVLVMPGITVGNGAVVGAGAVVTGDVDAYTLAAGCPARCIGTRFDGRVAAAIDGAAWWTWPESRMKLATEFFNADFTELPVDEALALIADACGRPHSETT